LSVPWFAKITKRHLAHLYAALNEVKGQKAKNSQMLSMKKVAFSAIDISSEYDIL